jgi:hypothetical protein
MRKSGSLSWLFLSRQIPFTGARDTSKAPVNGVESSLCYEIIDMKKIVVIMIGIILTLSLIPVSYAQSPETAVVRAVPETVQVPEDGQVNVIIEIQEIEALYAFDLLLTFDPDVIQVVDADPDLDGVQIHYGLFLDPGFVLRNEANNQTGTINFALTQLSPSSPKSGSGNLVVITFQGLASGSSSSLTIEETKFVRQDGSSIEVSTQQGEIQVVGTATPGPTNTPVLTQDPGTPLPTAPPATNTSQPSPTPEVEQVTNTPTATGTATLTGTASPVPTTALPTATRSATPGETMGAVEQSEQDDSEESLSNEQIAKTIAAMVPTATPVESTGVFQAALGNTALLLLGGVGLGVVVVGGFMFIRQRDASQEE